MLTATKKAKSKKKRTRRPALDTREGLSKHVRAKLKPAGHSPSGLDFYSYEDMKKLDVAFPKKK